MAAPEGLFVNRGTWPNIDSCLTEGLVRVLQRIDGWYMVFMTYGLVENYSSSTIGLWFRFYREVQQFGGLFSGGRLVLYVIAMHCGSNPKWWTVE